MWRLIHLSTSTEMYEQPNKRAVDKWFAEHEFFQNKVTGEVVARTKCLEIATGWSIKFDVKIEIKLDPTQWSKLNPCEFEVV